MNTYEERVRKYEAEGLTRSDAQGVVDAEDIRATRTEAAQALEANGSYADAETAYRELGQRKDLMLIDALRCTKNA